MTPEEMKLALARFQADPALFFERVLGVTTLEDYQRRVLKTIADNERTAVRACHDVGKSFLAARVVAWFLCCFPYSKAITTAPTYNQVKNILWAELRSAHARAKLPLGGRLNLTDWNLTPDGDWFAVGFTPKNEIAGEEGQGALSSFQGFHASNLLLVFDEATGVPPNIWSMAEGMLTSAGVKFLAIGNPTSRNSEFAKCFTSPEWAKEKLDCFDSPNFKANGIKGNEDLRAEVDRVKALPDAEAQARMKGYKITTPYLLTLKWVVGRLLKWGFDHPLSQGKIFAEFPEESDNVVVPLGIVEESQRRVVWPSAADKKLLGIDVARFGSDATIFTGLHGFKQTLRRMFTKRDLMEIAGEAIAVINAERFDVVTVDETGLGGGVVDALNQAKREGLIKCEVRGVQFGAACDEAEDKERYVNLKARMYGLLGDDMKRGLALMSEDVYLDELPTIQYRYDSKGRYMIESKDEYKRRTGRGSPDNSDSLALSNFGRYDLGHVGSFGGKQRTETKAPRAPGLKAGRLW